MCTKKCFSASLSLLMGLLVFATMTCRASAADPKGVWLTEDKDAVIEITNCNGPLCGRIIWFKDDKNRSGSPQLDRHNPDSAKQSRQICGLVVITALRPSGPNTWAGQAYNPQDGKTYSCNISVLSANALKVAAYVALPVFGRHQTWTRTDSRAANGIEYSCKPQDQMAGH